jgi:hypothetical protein
MATDFYQRQDDARRTTKWLVTMFTLAVIGVTVGTAAAVWLAMLAADGASHATRSLVDDGSFRLPAA